MKSKKTMFSAFIAVVLAFSFIWTPVYANLSTEAQNIILNELQEKGIISSSADFRPNDPCLKAEFLKMAYLSAGIKLEQTGSKTPFKDVPLRRWYAVYVKSALYIEKIIEYSESNPYFYPNSNITLGEALQILLLVNKVKIPASVKKEDIKFTDINVNSSLAKFAKAAINYGMFKSKKLLKPNKYLTRADCAELTYDFINKGNLPEIIQGLTIIIEGSDLEYGTSEIGKKLLKSEKFQILLDVLDKINTKFIDKSKIDLTELTYGAIKGMVSDLGDTYTVFQEPSKATSFTKSLTGEFDGIGISLEMVDGKVVIITPIKGTPAEAAGIKPGDIITKVNDQSVKGKQLDDVVLMIQGPVDTTVKLTILRSNEELNFTIKRAHIKITSIQYEMKGGNVAYIEIVNFTNNTPEEFQKAFIELLKTPPKGFVIDLRNNPGGFLNAAIAMLSHFVPKGKILMSMEYANGNKIVYESQGPAELAPYPIAILINKGSASASEIMATAIKDNNSAMVYIVGEPSFGKGSVQELINYVDGSMLRISMAKWLTPKGNFLTKENPIKPDYQVIDVQSENYDPALEKALNIISDF